MIMFSPVEFVSSKLREKYAQMENNFATIVKSKTVLSKYVGGF